MIKTHTRQISRRMYFVRNRGEYNMHKIYWCEEGMQMADISTNNFGKHYLPPRMRYFMVKLDNLDRKLVQEG